MEIVPGVHMVEGTRGGNVYLLVSDDGLALVDAALPGYGGRIVSYINSLGKSASELRYILLTHSHPDHTGAILSLTRESTAKVLVHERDTRRDKYGRPRLFYPGQLLTLLWRFPALERIYAHDVVRDGDTVPVMGGARVIHAPGHTPGSVAFYLEDRGVLFTGDTLLSNGKRFSRPLPFPGTDFREYRRSVERLARIEFDVACPGHGKPILSGAGPKVQEMLEDYFWSAGWWKPVRKLSRTRQSRPRPDS